MTVIRGTCSACASYQEGCCQAKGSTFAGRLMWAVACVPCEHYQPQSATRFDDLRGASGPGGAEIRLH